MTKFHDHPITRMEEQICRTVKLLTSCAGDSPVGIYNIMFKY